MNKQKLHAFKNVFLNTKDGVTDASRKLFTFNDLPIVQVKKKSVLRINSVTPHNVTSAVAGTIEHHSYYIKLHGLAFNHSTYMSSDKGSEPIIAVFNYNARNTIQIGHYKLELEPQDIINIQMECFNELNEGLVKSAVNFDLCVSFTIEELEE